MLILHYAPNTISVAVAIGLEETRVDYDPVKVDFANAAQTKAEYLAINPKGRVPTLVTERGHVCGAMTLCWPLCAVSLRPCSCQHAMHCETMHAGQIDMSEND